MGLLGMMEWIILTILDRVRRVPAEGAGSYFRGVWRFNRLYFRMVGGTFGCESGDKSSTEIALVIFSIEQYQKNPDFRRGVNKAIVDKAVHDSEHRADSAAARFATGALITKALTLAAGVPGNVGGISLGFSAWVGDFMYTIEQQVE